MVGYAITVVVINWSAAVLSGLTMFAHAFIVPSIMDTITINVIRIGGFLRAGTNTSGFSTPCESKRRKKILTGDVCQRESEARATAIRG